MASYNIPIIIQKLDNETEIWEDYYSTHSEINKTSGKEYFNASSNISSSIFDFKLRFCEKVEDIIFNTEIYRIIYKNRTFNIIDADRYKENDNNITLKGKINVNKN